MIFRSLSASLAVLVAISLPLAERAAADPFANSGPKGPIPLLEVQRDASPYFNKVVSNLDVGGQVLEYHDYEGRRNMLVALLTAGLQAFPDLQQAGHPIDPGALIDATGLARSAASGESLIKGGDGWRMRSYSYLPDGREGLAKLLGAQAVPFESAKWLPASTDLLVDARLDATTLPETARKIAAACGYEEVLAHALAQPALEGETVKSILEKMNFHLTLGIDLSAWGEVASDQKPFDFILRIEGAAALLKIMQPDLERDMGKPESHGSRMGWEFPFEPSLQKEKAILLYDEAGTLTFASREDYLKKSEGAEPKLADSKAYRDQTHAFPDSGNFLAYASPKVNPVLRWLAGSLLAEAHSPASPVLGTLAGGLPAQPWSVCVACEADGIYTVAKMPISPEFGGASAALPALSGSAIAFTGARAWKKGSDRAACITSIRAVQQAVRKVQNDTHAVEGTPIDWDRVWAITPKPSCPAHGHYTFAKTYPKTGELACTCDDEDHVFPHENW